MVIIGVLIQLGLIMAITLKQFVEHLTDSGLMSTEEVSAFEDGLPPEQRPSDVQGLARELVKSGKLTRYQVQAVYQGRTRGLVLGDYVVLDKIGAGGMGQVLKARHRRMERIVALKVLPTRTMKSPDAVKRFQREVKAAARLEHPNIVTAYDAGEADGIHFLVMQYVDGKDLSEIVRERGPFPVQQAVDCILQTARGLEYAHGEGVIHRDIKPANLLLDTKGNVQILDMGLARMDAAIGPTGATGAERLTDSGQVMGTCDYMAPEQAEDTHAADHRADIYSLGCTLYRLLTGKLPYAADMPIQVLVKHREAEIPSLCEARPDVPAELEGIFRKMMAKRPEDRYQSMTELIADLESHMATKEKEPLAAAEFSSDVALTEFLQGLSQGGSTTKKAARVRTEETVARHVDRETGTGLATKLVRAVPPKLLPFLGVGGGIAGFVVLLGFLFILVGREETIKPDGYTTIAQSEGLEPESQQEENAPGEEWPTISPPREVQPVPPETQSVSLPFEFSKPVNLGPIVNSKAGDAGLALSADALTLLFGSDRPGGQGNGDLWMCGRGSSNAPFDEPVNLGPTVNSGAIDADPALSGDGLTLLFQSNRPGGQGTDLWMCRRASPSERFGKPVNLGPTVNSGATDGVPALSADGLTLLFTSDRPGGQGSLDLWMCRRGSPNAPFGEPVNLGPTINSSSQDTNAALSADGLTLLFTSNRPGRPRRIRPLDVQAAVAERAVRRCGQPGLDHQHQRLRTRFGSLRRRPHTFIRFRSSRRTGRARPVDVHADAAE